jgi:hypothetical protein
VYQVCGYSVVSPLKNKIENLPKVEDWVGRLEIKKYEISRFVTATETGTFFFVFEIFESTSIMYGLRFLIEISCITR